MVVLVIAWSFALAQCCEAALLYHYKLNGTTDNQDAASGFDGTYIGAATNAADRNGNAAQAVDFNNISRLQMTIDSNITGPFSVSAWVKHHTAATTPSYRRIVDNVFNSGFYLGTSGTGVATGDGDRYLFIVRSNPGNFPNNAYGALGEFTTSWTHVVGTWDGTNSRIYVNGVAPSGGGSNPVGTPSSNPNGNTALAIGANNSGGENWDGLIDDVAIADAAFNAAEVYALYSLGLGSANPANFQYDADDVQALFDLFDDGNGSGTVVVDGTIWEFVAAGLAGGLGNLQAEPGGVFSLNLAGGGGVQTVLLVPEPAGLLLGALGATLTFLLLRRGANSKPC